MGGVTRCRLCKSADLFLDEALNLYRCRSCWSVHIPDVEPPKLVIEDDDERTE